MGKKGKAVMRAAVPVPLPVPKTVKEIMKPAPAPPSDDEVDEDAEDFVPEGMDADPMAFLTAPKLPADLFRRDWERRPVLIKATEDRKAFFEGLFDFDGLISLAMVCGAQGGGEEGEDDDAPAPLQFGTDVNAAKYVDGVRTTPNGEVCDAPTLRALHKDGCTFQLMQPQRFSDVLWRLLGGLERQLGCLVGCNAYITPQHTQGLAPHCDDVEIFVCQTGGSKQWRLYAPQPGCELPSVPSGDLDPEAIGAPTMDITLEVGDVLYMPRGTIHQAIAQEGGSSHLTLSTYQRWNHAELLQHLLRTATSAYTPLDAAAGGSKAAVAQSTEVLPRALLESLPQGFLFKCGLQADLLADLAAETVALAAGKAPPLAVPPTTVATAGRLANGLRALADLLERPGQAQPLLSAATDAMAADFIRSRLPPHPAQLRPTGPAPTLEDSVMCRGEGLFLLVPVAGPPDEDVPEGFVQLCTCLHNDRDSHMISRVNIQPAGSDSGSDHSSDEEEDGHVHAAACAHKHHHHHHGEADEGSSDEEEEEKEEGHVHSAACAHKHGHGHGHHKHGHGHGKKKGGKGHKGHDEEDEEEGSSGSEEEDEDEEGSEGSSDEGRDGGEASSSDSLPGTVFPGSYAYAITQVLGALTEATAVPLSKLRVPSGSPEEKLRLAYTLWSDGYICTVPAPVEAPPAAAALPKLKGAGKKQRKPAASGAAAAPAAAAPVTVVAAGKKAVPAAAAAAAVGVAAAPKKKHKAQGEAAAAPASKVAKHGDAKKH